jgi:hypothetical protein
VTTADRRGNDPICGHVEADMHSLVRRWRIWTGALAVTLAVAALLSWRFDVFDEPIPVMPECAPHLLTAETIASTRVGVDKVFAPPGASGILACYYQLYRDEKTAAFANRLRFRYVATRAQMSDLSTTFDVAVKTPPCTTDDQDSLLGYPVVEFVLRYPSGPDVRVLVYYETLCGARGGGPIGFTATNGTVTGFFYLGSAGNVLFDFTGPEG